MEFKIAKNMVKTLSNSNANSVVQLLSGFVGAIHTFASPVIKDNAAETMFQENQKISSQNVRDHRSVH